MSDPWLLDMVWRDVCFAHWRADAAIVARALPAGVTLDTFAGDAWLSIVPFRLTGVRLRCMPVLPGFTDIPEINLRTYVRVGDVPGIWFFSLDAAGAPAVVGARFMTSLPYFHARIATREADGEITYASERREPRVRAGRFTARYRAPTIERTVESRGLEAFLHERYRFFTRRSTTLVSGRIAHAPWSLGPIAIDITENTLGDLIGHPLVGPPAVAYFARERRVRAGAVRLVTSR